MAKRLNEIIWIDRGWQPVAIGFCPSKKAWKRSAKLNHFDPNYPGMPDEGGHTSWMKNDTTGHALIVVTLADTNDPVQLLMTIVHEAVHCWQFLCDHIGEKKPGMEMEAYGIEHIARGLHDAYCRTQGKGKKWL